MSASLAENEDVECEEIHDDRSRAPSYLYEPGAMTMIATLARN